MPLSLELRLAESSDAPRIAGMSRDLIEVGLGWSWTPSRVTRSIRGHDTTVLVACVKQRVTGFAIMRFFEQEAHLDLLGVSPEYQHNGIGRQLISWLEETALVAGVSVIYLEVRATNGAALAFYGHLGYRKIQQVVGYYQGREMAVRMARDLWSTTSTSST